MRDRSSPEARARSWRERATASALLPIGALGLALAWLVLRAPNLIVAPRYWAEEGAFVAAASRLDALDAAAFVYWRAGYFAWPSNLGAILGVKLLPVEWAPLATTLVALVLQISPFAAILWLRFGFPLGLAARLIAATALLTATTTGQGIAWLNTINSQMHLGILAAVLLVASARQASARASAALVAVLVLAGLSGAYANFLLPAFLAAALAERDAWRWRQTAALAATFGVQLAIVLYKRFGLGQIHEKRAAAPLDLDAIVAGARESIAMPLFGQRAVIGAPVFADLLLAVALGVLAAAIFVLARSAANRSAAERTSEAAAHAPDAAASGRERGHRLGLERLRPIGSLELRCVCAWLAMDAAIALVAFEGVPVGRYAVVPGALGLILVLLAAQRAPSRPLRALFAATIATAIATGVWNPRHPEVLACDGRTSGYRAAARSWSGEGTALLPICPDGWRVKRHAPAREAGS